MVIPAILASIISSIILNLGFTSDDFLFQKKGEFFDKGQVLGVYEGDFLDGVKISEQKFILKKGEDIKNDFQNFLDNIVSLVRGPEKVPNTESLDIKVGPKKINNFDIPRVTAKSALVYDIESGRAVYSKNVDEKTQIASITKLMTALVFLENNNDWDEYYKITKEDRRDGGRIYLYLGDTVKVRDLFNLSLVGSANTATVALVHSTGMSEEEFVEEMNRKAQELDLKNTYFKDTTGLSSENISNALDLVKLMKVVLENQKICEVIEKEKISFETLEGKTKTVYSTDKLLESLNGSEIKILGGKTGYTEDAGFCFVSSFSNENEKKLISVILGSRDVFSRFEETRDLVDYVYGSYGWE